MDLQKACDILGITKENFTAKEVKKAYYQKALETHPDKNKVEGSSEIFAEVQNAYTYLHNFDELKSDIDIHEAKESSTYSDILSSFIKATIGIEIKSEQLATTLTQVKKGYEEATVKMFTEMDRHQAARLYAYLAQYSSVFGFSEEILARLKEELERKITSDIFITVEPTLTNLLDQKVYKLEHLGELYFIPLWHDELEFELGDKQLIVIVNPKLPKNCWIDDSGTLHIRHNCSINEALDKGYVTIQVEDKTFSILSRDLTVKKEQTICIRNKGIPCVDTRNIFDVGKLNHVYIHLTMTR
jgi:DnaJ-class molecular chaperone